MNTIPEQSPGPGSPGGQEKPVTNEPIIEKIRKMNSEELLRWIQGEKPELLKGEVLKKFKKEYISGYVFLDRAGDRKFFREESKLPSGPSLELAKLASEVIGKETMGIKRGSEQAESSSTSPKRTRLDSDQKGLPLSRLKGSSAIYETKSAANPSHPCFPANAAFSKFFNRPSTIVADKTHFIPLLEKDDTFQYMFLRPRRWGKSTFLNMLAAYYDVKTKDLFQEIFGGLHIGSAPTESRNSHLILLFDFSTITSTEPFEEVTRSVFDTVSWSLRTFLLKYQDMLGNASPEKYIVPDRIGISLKNVLGLIQRHGHTAFVGVDEYDAPANTCLTGALEDREYLSESKQTIRRLADLLNHQFFSIIKQFCGDAVQKYWITGVLPAFRDGISPLTATEIISFKPEYQSLCGFTQEDVHAIVTRALPENRRASTLASLKRWYNGYMFSPYHPENPTLYNPQQVFVYLRMTISNPASLSHTDEANAVHTKNVLSLVRETGPVTIYDLVGMLSTKASANIMSELSFIELMQEYEIRSSNTTWSLLYYLGIVTFCEGSGDEEEEEGGGGGGGEEDGEDGEEKKEKMDCLRIPNDNMDHMIRERIIHYLKGDPGFLTRMRTSYTDFMHGNTLPFIDLLEEFFRQRPIRSHADTAESNLEMAIEFLWIEQKQCRPQVHLVVDSTKWQGRGLNGFTDMLVGNSQRQRDTSNPVLVMELKNVSLLNLWKGKQKYPSAKLASQNEYTPVLDELHKATEDELLNLKYSFFNKDVDRWETKQVKDILQEGTAQLNHYISIISLEQPRPGRQGRNGIVDDKVWCRNGGRDVLWGYVIVCLGGARVICRQMAKIETQHTYLVRRGA